MRQITQVSSHIPPPAAINRLESFLSRRGYPASGIEPLTPDASTRVYFRVPWGRATAVAALYPEPFDPEVHPFLDVTRVFAEGGLPVPSILAVEPAEGILIQEDLGDEVLRHVLESAPEPDVERYQEEAISLIAKIQALTPLAAARNSIASRLAFDEAKLSWELDFFFEHYFGSLRKEKMSHGEAAEIRAEMNDIAADLAARPRTLCHRDYHTSNLIVDSGDRVRIIDHQDARMGPASYDLVSLLLDRRTELPSFAEIRAHRLFFLEERRRLGLSPIDPDDFAREFRLMTVQRNLKAIGTFSYQTAVNGRGETYARFIRPTFQTALHAMEWLERFPALRRAIASRMNDEIEWHS